MTYEETMKQLSLLGSEQTKKTLTKHGAKEPFFGVKVGDMKALMKKTGKDHELALRLYASGNSDAMYFAGLICDPMKFSKQDLNRWVNEAYWYMLSQFTVAWAASESPFAIELGIEWIESPEEFIANAGWSTLASYASVSPAEKIDIELYRELLHKAEEKIHGSMNRVRYAMNNFVIATASFIPELTDKGKETAAKIGIISVEMGGTACKVPFAPDYIKKVESMGRVGKKRKSAFC